MIKYCRINLLLRCDDTNRIAHVLFDCNKVVKKVIVGKIVTMMNFGEKKKNILKRFSTFIFCSLFGVDCFMIVFIV